MRSLSVIIILVAMVTMTCLQAQGSAVYFADANLKAAVEAELGVTNPSDTDMLGLTSLTAGSLNIADLTGLEYGMNLAELNLNNNQIIDISHLSGLTNLEDLNLGNNQISDTGVSYLSGLVTLGVGDLIFTGTPAGVGPTVRGDRLDARIEGIGEMVVTMI